MNIEDCSRDWITHFVDENSNNDDVDYSNEIAELKRQIKVRFTVKDTDEDSFSLSKDVLQEKEAEFKDEANEVDERAKEISARESEIREIRNTAIERNKV